MRSVYTRRFENLNKVEETCVMATMDCKLEEQKSVIKFLLLEDEKPCHIFQCLQKTFFKVCISFKLQLLSYPPYSQDLASCDFYVSRTEKKLPGNKYESRAALLIATSTIGLRHGLQREYKSSHEDGKSV